MSNEKVRRISAELNGDHVVVVDTLIASLQIKGSKKEVDSQLVELALDSLERTISLCSKESGKRFPSMADIKKYLLDTDAID